ncbi:hypothetical protein PMAYCL1PPCAC_13463, partial [Pristionchus mayeri]
LSSRAVLPPRPPRAPPARLPYLLPVYSMIRQRDFSSLRPLIFIICVFYLLVTLGIMALSLTLNTHKRAHGGDFQCMTHDNKLTCRKIKSSTAIQVLVWIESLLLLPIIILCMLTLWARSFVERLPGNTPIAIPVSLVLMFVLQIVFLIICFATGFIKHHWAIDLMLIVQSLFALPVAYIFFNLPQINGDSEPPLTRDDRHNLLKNAKAHAGASSTMSAKSGPPVAKPPPPTSTVTTTEQQFSPTATGSREGGEEEPTAGQSVTGSKEPSAEPIPVMPTSDPAVTATEGRGKSEKTDDKSGKPAAAVPPQSEPMDSESKKKAIASTTKSTTSGR